MRLVRRELSKALLWYFGVLHDPPKRGRGGLGAYRWPCEEYGGGSSWKVKGLGEVFILHNNNTTRIQTVVHEESCVVIGCMFLTDKHLLYSSCGRRLFCTP